MAPRLSGLLVAVGLLLALSAAQLAASLTGRGQRRADLPTPRSGVVEVLLPR
ncbi:MAG TPA: hypothetical protein VFV36_08570 [Candidatus Methylomirabilis sp.]|nr:hypothetical protein [Candidatus Methylomirabilis sp.]